MSLSFLHGFLELPLDHQTFLNVDRELFALASERLRGAAATTDSIGRSRRSEAEPKFA